MEGPADDPRASVIIATWNAGDVLAACLESVGSQEFAGGFETIVVDNASSDGTAKLLDGFAGRMTIIANAENAGFSAANNQAARRARGRVLCFLNSDTELLTRDTLERLVEAVEAPGVGLAGPMLLNPDGSLQPSCGGYPSVWRALLVASGVHRLLPDRLRARATPHTWSHDRMRDTDWVMGAAVAVRADVFRAAGGFWPAMYGEEEDLAYEVRQRGLRVRFQPSARVMHVGNHSLMQRWSDTGRAARVANAELVFLRRHYSRPRAAAIRTITGCGYAVRALLHGLLGHPQAAIYRSMTRAYVSGTQGPER